jgi:hypothetical protein
MLKPPRGYGFCRPVKCPYTNLASSIEPYFILDEPQTRHTDTEQQLRLQRNARPYLTRRRMPKPSVYGRSLVSMYTPG